jgi:hypothetical protein
MTDHFDAILSRHFFTNPKQMTRLVRVRNTLIEAQVLPNF